MPNDRDEPPKSLRERLRRKNRSESPEPMDLDETKRASTAQNVKSKHRSPDVKVRDEPRPSIYEDESGGWKKYLNRIKHTLEILWLRIKSIISQLVQLIGLYLIFASALEIFGRELQAGGIPVNRIPTVLMEPYFSIGVADVFLLVIGIGIVWVATSRWFL